MQNQTLSVFQDIFVYCGKIRKKRNNNYYKTSYDREGEVDFRVTEYQRYW